MQIEGLVEQDWTTKDVINNVQDNVQMHKLLQFIERMVKDTSSLIRDWMLEVDSVTHRQHQQLMLLFLCWQARELHQVLL